MLVWVTRQNMHSLTPSTTRCIVNSETVDAIVPDDEEGGGCTLYWMAGQTSWRITESIDKLLSSPAARGSKTPPTAAGIEAMRRVRHPDWKDI